MNVGWQSIVVLQERSSLPDVYTVRDFTSTNAEGEGKLTRIELYSQKEFDQRTADWTTGHEYDGTAKTVTSDAD